MFHVPTAAKRRGLRVATAGAFALLTATAVASPALAQSGPKMAGGRAEVRAGTPLGREVAAYQRRGDLVPDQIVFDLLTPVVSAAAARGGAPTCIFPSSARLPR